MKKTTRTSLIALFVTIALCASSCGSSESEPTVTTAAVTKAAITTTSVSASDGTENQTTNPSLSFDKYYIIMPELQVRADPDTPGPVDTVYAGDEVEFLYSAGDYSQFRYQRDGETREGSTWTGAIAPAVRIHLLEDAFVFHRPGQKRDELGSISTWREPTDPDLLVLFEETVDNESWLYVLSVEDCRAGYMRGDIPYEIVE